MTQYFNRTCQNFSFTVGVICLLLRYDLKKETESGLAYRQNHSQTAKMAKYGRTQINAASDEFTFAEEKKTLKPGKKVNTWEIDFC